MTVVDVVDVGVGVGVEFQLELEVSRTADVEVEVEQGAEEDVEVAGEVAIDGLPAFVLAVDLESYEPGSRSSHA